MKHKGYNNGIAGRDHQYGYNGKEEQNELNLNWIDLGARHYDPSIGRFMVVDPMADFVNYQSPFVLADNNPIGNIDEYGLGRTPWWLRWLVGGSGRNCSCKQREGVVGFIKRLFAPKPNKKKKRKKRKKRKKSSSGGSNNNSQDETRPPVSALNFDGRGITERGVPIDVPDIEIPVPVKPRKTIPVFRGQAITDPISFELTVGFQVNSDKFVDKRAAHKTLNDLLKTLKEYPQLKVLIIGNTSQNPDASYKPRSLDSKATLNGNENSTIRELQLARAKAVERFLFLRDINWRRISVGTGEIRFEGPEGRTTRFILINTEN